MAVRRIRIWPDPALKEVAAAVAAFDAELRTLVDDLFETMYKANGVGLAATQLAVPQRVLVIDLDPRGDAKEDPELAKELTAMGFAGPVALVNPEIVSADGEIKWEEGCLSVPGVNEEITRKGHVVVKAQYVKGKVLSFEATGLFAVAVQHEMDHLVGKVFVDYLSRLKRDVIKRKMERLKADDVDDGVAAAAML
ncbi:MAG: peptide deformylase [Deltaproteobacteria bacterium]|nr:peptide deformylase [Deltaproteobacteria bacterium]